MNRPRLAIVTFDFWPDIGGVQNYLYEICSRLTSKFDIIVVTPVAGEAPDGVHKLIVPEPTVTHFFKMIRQTKTDFLLIGHAHPQLLLAAKLSRLPYAALAYGNDFLAAQKAWHRPFFNRWLAQATPLITISDANIHRLQSLGMARPELIYPGTDPSRFWPAEKPRSKSLNLLTVCRLVPRKGIDTTLKALAIIRNTYPHLHYFIGGMGPDLPRLQQLVSQLNLEDMVTFLGFVAEDQLPITYQKADIFVMPTRERPSQGSIEGFGIVYLEASATGLPVIASPSGGAAEAVQDGKTGLLVPPNDPEALAKALSKLLEDEALRNEFGRNGRSWVETSMNWDRAGEQFLSVLAKWWSL
ncbi:MAG: glycoside hydrolase [Ardenticatenaceae bacterium]|nr:MAG: glycoside hydrolase [Ardenticatenaceae bacterium]